MDLSLRDTVPVVIVSPPASSVGVSEEDVHVAALMGLAGGWDRNVVSKHHSERTDNGQKGLWLRVGLAQRS